MKKRKGRLLTFRSGDRSEYLALFLVSRFAFINPVPRQEDFGLADFICFVGREEDQFFHAEDAFLLQIKSNKRKIQLKNDPSNYLKKHADLPLIICVTSTEKKLIQFYSSWRLWCYLSLQESSNISKINLVFDKYTFGNETNSKAYRVIEDNVLEVTLGNPFLTKPFEKAEIIIAGGNFMAIMIKSTNLAMIIHSHFGRSFSIEDANNF